MARDLVKARTTVRVLASRISIDDKEAVRLWVIDLLRIRDAELTRFQKVREIGRGLKEHRAIQSIIKLIAKETKRHAWDNRSERARWGIAAAGGGLLLFGSQGAGLAAFGGAIGLPLFVVFGAGGALAHVILEEFAISTEEDDARND